MKYQITQQANDKFSVYTDNGASMSMADETLMAHDVEMKEAAEYAEYCEARSEIDEEPLTIEQWREFNESIGDCSGQ